MPALDVTRATAELAACDRRLARVIRRVGPCTLAPARTQSLFMALLDAIVSQQLSGKAAATILGRVCALYAPARGPTPETLLATDEAALRGAGLSRAKAAALRDLAAKTLDGTVPTLRQLARMSDDAIIERLTTVRGIGRWTVEMLLIFRLGRPDVWPVDDLGVRKGWARIHGLEELPRPRDLVDAADTWRPWRSVAAWYCWRVLDTPGA